MIAALLWALGFALASDQTDLSDAEDLGRLQEAVTRSRGKPGGITVFWPRVIPAGTDPEVMGVAAALQERLQRIADRAAPVAPRDVRPAPERVCPRERGCRSASLGVLVGHQDGGCVAVALIGRPGAVPVQLVPLAGQVELASPTVPYRAPPESAVVVREFVPCGRLVDAVDDTAAVLALRRALEASTE